MHCVFGTKEDAAYLDREGAYLIPIRQNQVGVVRTSKGYFLLGGGLEPGEEHIACIQRECLEEAGYTVRVDERVCSAETYERHPTIGYFHPVQTYYVGELLSRVAEAAEEDHAFLWIDYNEIRGKMYLQMQNWALEQCFSHVSHQ